MKKWNRFRFLPVLPLGEKGRMVTGSKEHIALSRQAAAEETGGSDGGVSDSPFLCRINRIALGAVIGQSSEHTVDPLHSRFVTNFWDTPGW